IKQQILDPLELQAGYCVDSLQQDRFVNLYTKEGEQFVPQAAAYSPRSDEIQNYEIGVSTPVFSPTGGMKISAHDLARYMLMHMNYGSANGVQILSESSAKQMQKGLSEKAHYGLALQETEDLIPKEHLVGHTGSAYGLYSNMF